jgi:hypothetical protein
MKCSCLGELRIMHTCMAGSRAESRDLKCEDCGKRYSSVTFLVEKPSQKPKKKGHGAIALAKKLLQGSLVLKAHPTVTGSQAPPCEK